MEIRPLFSRPWLRWPWLRWLPALVPPLLILHWMRAYLVNVPFMDDYVWLPFYRKFHDGTFRWADLMFVQMEHRLTVPAFLTWLFYHVAPGKIVLQNWSSYAQLCLTAVNLAWLLRRTMPGLRLGWLAGIIGSVALFSPVQAYTLLWADCFSSYMAPLFLTWGMVALFSRLRVWVRFGLCVGAAGLGSVSFGSGLLIWLLLIPLIVWTDALPDARTRKWFLVAWLVAFGIALKLYFIDLVNQALPAFSYEQGHEATFGVHAKAALHQPGRLARFVLTFAGSALGRGSYAALGTGALVAGVLLATVCAAAGIPLLRFRKDAALRAATLPWLVLAAYAFGMGGMVALSRLYANPSLIGALWNRYTIHSHFTVVAVVVLAIFWLERWRRAATGYWRARLALGAPLVLGMVAWHLVGGWIYGEKIMEAWWSSRLRDATCQLFAKAVPLEAIQGPLTKNQALAVQMDDIGLLQPPMPGENRLDHFKMQPRVAPSTARLESVVAVDEGGYELNGIAFLKGQRRTADGVLICYRDVHKHWRVISVAQVRQEPLFLRDSLAADMQYLYARRPGPRQVFLGEFSALISDEMLPKGITDITAWTFDFQKQTASRMLGLFRIDPEHHKVRRLEETAHPDDQ